MAPSEARRLHEFKRRKLTTNHTNGREDRMVAGTGACPQVPGSGRRPCAWHHAFCAHALKFCAHALKSCAHALQSCAHALQSCAHALKVCAHALKFCAHALKFCAHALKVCAHALKVCAHALKFYAHVRRFRMVTGTDGWHRCLSPITFAAADSPFAVAVASNSDFFALFVLVRMEFCCKQNFKLSGAAG
jgi:hypothetical protein